MIAKKLGRTSLYVSQLGFGCGSMGGLLVRGNYPTMRDVVARALELGTAERRPVASPTVDPIASAPEYEADVARARRFSFLIDEGVVDSLVEAAIRFVISHPGVSTALLGISSREQLEQAVQYVKRGPLPAEVLQRIVLA